MLIWISLVTPCVGTQSLAKCKGQCLQEEISLSKSDVVKLVADKRLISHVGNSQLRWNEPMLH